MELDGVDIAPAEGRVILRFVDDEDVEPGDDYEGCLAVVVAVGPKVTGVKKGQVAICSPWARDGLKVGDNTVMAYGSDIVGTIK